MRLPARLDPSEEGELLGAGSKPELADVEEGRWLVLKSDTEKASVPGGSQNALEDVASQLGPIAPLRKMSEEDAAETGMEELEREPGGRTVREVAVARSNPPLHGSGIGTLL